MGDGGGRGQSVLPCERSMRRTTLVHRSKALARPVWRLLPLLAPRRTHRHRPTPPAHLLHPPTPQFHLPPPASTQLPPSTPAPQASPLQLLPAAAPGPLLSWQGASTQLLVHEVRFRQDEGLGDPVGHAAPLGRPCGLVGPHWVRASLAGVGGGGLGLPLEGGLHGAAQAPCFRTELTPGPSPAAVREAPRRSFPARATGACWPSTAAPDLPRACRGQTPPSCGASAERTLRLAPRAGWRVARLSSVLSKRWAGNRQPPHFRATHTQGLYKPRPHTPPLPMLLPLPVARPKVEQILHCPAQPPPKSRATRGATA